MYKNWQDDRSRNAGEANVYRVQIDRRRDHSVASIRISEGSVVRLSRHYTYRCTFVGIVVLELLESTIMYNDGDWL